MSVRRGIAPATAVLFIQLSIVPGVALAQAPEEIVRGYLSDLDAIADLGVAYDAIGTDAATGETRVSNLSVTWTFAAPASPDSDGEAMSGEMRIDVPEVLFAGLSLADGVYRADRIVSSPITASAMMSDGSQDAVFKVEGAGSEVVAPVWAMLPEIVVDPARPASSYAPLFDWLLSQSFESATVDASVITMVAEGTDQVTRQGPITMGRLSDGLLDRYETGESVSEMTAVADADGIDQPIEMTMTILPTRAEEMSYKPIVRFFTGEGAGTSGAYQSVVARASADGMRLTSDLFTFDIGRIVYEGFKLKSPETPFLVVMDDILTGKIDENDPKAILDMVFDLYGAFAFDLMQMGEMSFEVPGVAGGRIGEIVVADLSSAGLGRFGFGGIEVSAPDTDVRLGAFTIADLKFPSREAIFALEGMAEEEEPDFAAIAQVIPQLGLFAIEGVFAQTPMAPEPLQLGALRLEQGNFLPIPTRNMLEMTGLSVPLAYVEDEEVRSRLAALGADPVEASARLELNWDADSLVLDLGPIEIDLPKIGALSLAGHLGGVPQMVFETPEQAQAALATLSFNALELFYEDRGLVPFALEEMAMMMGVPAGEIPDFIAGQVEAGIAGALPGGEALARDTAATVRRFLSDPQSLKLTAVPPAPVPVAQILGTAAMAPATIPAILNLKLEANSAR
jgi:hypothetical protein